MHLLGGLAFACLVTLVHPAWAQAQPGSAVVIELKGYLRTEAVDSLRKALANVDRDRYPAGAILLIDSPGGDAEAGLSMGRLARTANAHAFVRGRCASACVYVLAGSVLRAAPAGAVGLRKPFVTRTRNDQPGAQGEAMSEADAARDPRSLALLRAFEARLKDYLAEMDMPPALFHAMMAVPEGQTRYVDREALAAYGLLGFDASYAASSTRRNAERLQLPQAEMTRRAIAAQDECVPSAPAPAEFARCYRRTLELRP